MVHIIPFHVCELWYPVFYFLFSFNFPVTKKHWQAHTVFISTLLLPAFFNTYLYFLLCVSSCLWGPTGIAVGLLQDNENFWSCFSMRLLYW